MSTTVTKESLAARIADLEYGPRSLKEDYTLAAYKMLLSMMEAEPVAWTSEEAIAEVYCDETGMIGPKHMVGDVPIYRHAQPAPVVGIEPEAWLWSRDGDAERDVSLTPPDDDADAADAIECGWTATPLYRHAQQLLVPPMQHWEELCREHPDMSIGDAIIRAAWWNHCRAAMLNRK